MRREKSNSQALLDSANDLMAYAKSLPEVSTRINEETELVLEVDARQDSTTYSYYFVDHATRMIFWAHPYTCEPDGEVLLNVKAAKKYSHISRWSNATRFLLNMYFRILIRGAILAGVLYMHRYAPCKSLIGSVDWYSLRWWCSDTLLGTTASFTLTTDIFLGLFLKN